MYDMKALHEAKSVDDAVRLLQEYPQAQVIAGGSDVLVQMREGKRAGAELVSIYRISDQFLTHYERPDHPEIYQRSRRSRRYGRRTPDTKYRNHRREYL